MNFWQNAVVTDAGIALQSRIINGHTLKIVRAVTGEIGRASCRERV